MTALHCKMTLRLNWLADLMNEPLLQVQGRRIFKVEVDLKPRLRFRNEFEWQIFILLTFSDIFTKFKNLFLKVWTICKFWICLLLHLSTMFKWSIKLKSLVVFNKTNRWFTFIVLLNLLDLSIKIEGHLLSNDSNNEILQVNSNGFEIDVPFSIVFIFEMQIISSIDRNISILTKNQVFSSWRYKSFFFWIFKIKLFAKIFKWFSFLLFVFSFFA